MRWSTVGASRRDKTLRVRADKIGVQFGGDEVVKAKEGGGSATLSMAYAGYRFAERVLKAAKGDKGIVEPTYIYLPGVEGGMDIAKQVGVEYFSAPVELGVCSSNSHRFNLDIED